VQSQRRFQCGSLQVCQPASPAPWLMSCSSPFQLVPFNATVDRLRCRVPVGVGGPLRFSLLICTGPVYGCLFVADKTNTLSYPRPVFVATTLHFTSLPSGPLPLLR
jgi:hypothetical protein